MWSRLNKNAPGYKSSPVPFFVVCASSNFEQKGFTTKLSKNARSIGTEIEVFFHVPPKVLLYETGSGVIGFIFFKAINPCVALYYL